MPEETKEQELEAATGEDNTEEKEDDPSDNITEDHPRFKDVYGKWKRTERATEDLKKSLEERNVDLELLKQHNQRLEQSISAVQSKVDSRAEEKPAPDPIENPTEYHEWWKTKYESDRQRDRQTSYAVRIGEQIDAQRDIHEDYESIVKPVMAEIEINPELKNRIWNSTNPAREAYKYGKEKMVKKENNSERERAIDQGLVEGVSSPPAKKSDTRLTPDQARVAKLLGISQDKYLKQLKEMEK